jgi:DNA-binding MarR family transcriptional regulator
MSGGIRPADIAKKAGVTRQAIHQVVEDLESLGLIEMQADPKDRRSKLVVITSRGRKFDAAVQEVSTEIEELLSARIGLVAVSNLRMGLGADWGDPALDHDKPPVNLWWI